MIDKVRPLFCVRQLTDDKTLSMYGLLVFILNKTINFKNKNSCIYFSKITVLYQESHVRSCEYNEPVGVTNYG